MTLADRIVVMKDGLIAQTGTPSELYDAPADQFVAGFIGAPAMNFFPGTVEADGSGPTFRSDCFMAPIPLDRFDGLAPGQPVVAGLRPEDIVPLGHGAVPHRAVQVEGRVVLSEMLGSETLILTRLGETEAMARMAQPRPVASDERLVFALNLDKLHLFDPNTQQSLRAG
jgi:multiple sugar transport system ATP-binding protein